LRGRRWHGDCSANGRSTGVGAHQFQADAGPPTKETHMLSWALAFFIIALVAGVLGFGGIAGAAAGIAQILFFLFLVLLAISLVAYLFNPRRGPPL
jgi:uncharacterized membrane protein YtjA (UPF0391 family)